MMDKSDGMYYAPTARNKPEPVVAEGEFIFSAAYLDHGHIYGQVNGLLEAGGTLKTVYDPDQNRLAAFLRTYPQAQSVDCFERILEDKSINLVASAAVPSERGAIGLKVMRAGKDYFTDKAPFTTLQQLDEAKAAVAQTGKKYLVYFSERLHNESAWYASQLIKQGAIGKVLQVLVLAPHRLNKVDRPDWFFQKDKYGGILTDIGSHQFEQFLAYTGSFDAEINFARVENFGNPDVPGLEDFGEASLTMASGASCYCRLDWFTPDGLSSWGDGRTFVTGDKGYMEVRKYVDPARDRIGDKIILVDGLEETEIECSGRVGFPFFGQLVLDILNRTEKAMTQEHAFKAAELSMKAQLLADRNRK